LCNQRARPLGSRTLYHPVVPASWSLPAVLFDGRNGLPGLVGLFLLGPARMTAIDVGCGPSYPFC
jgi:hypothetical protein